METIKKLYEKAKGTREFQEIIDEWIDVFDEHLLEMEIEDKRKYEKLIDEFCVAIYGEHMTERMANEAVSEMIGADGRRGGKWTFEEAKAVAKHHGIRFDGFNEYEWYYVLNMMYSDYCKIFNNEEDIYVKMAEAWFMDKDVDEGKTYRYYKEVVC